MTSQPPNRPASPAGSFYALSDDEDGEYNTVTQLETGKGVKLLFSKSKVYVHPSRSERDNIAGYMALLQQKSPRDARPATSASDGSMRTARSSDLLLAWVPESFLGDAESIYVKVDMCDADSPPRQTYIVAPPPTVTSHTGVSDGYAFAIPVSAIFSLQIRPPNPGWFYGSIIINSRLGATFPPLFFHDNECQSTQQQKKKHMRENFDPFGSGDVGFWGGPEVLKWLKRFVHVERSTADMTVYLVEPTKEDSVAFGGQMPRAEIIATRREPRPTSSRPVSMGSADPFMKMVRETGWNIMEKFSKVTTFTRRTAEDAINNPNLPPQVKKLIGSPQAQTLQDEFESARVYLARWAMGLQEQSERERGHRLWTARDVIDLEETDVGDFEILDGTSSMALADRRKRVTMEEWNKWFDPTTGRLSITVDEVKERIFHGGLDPEDGVRKEAWLFLLGVYEWYSTADERKAQIASLRDHYYRLKSSWWERLENMGGDTPEGEEWREQRNRIEKDVHRTDRNVDIFAGDTLPHPDPNSPFADIGTNVHLEQLKEMLLTYNEVNKTLGYVQGMSDLLSPIYSVVQDDAIAFWAFVHFMERMERNFLVNQSGMRAQLLALNHLVRFMDPVLYRHLESTDSTNFFFFFRMMLVWYKREFNFPDVLRLWDAFFTDYLSSNFHLFIAMAILEKHRDVMIDHLRQFDEVLKYVNELSCTMDLGELLIRAESLFRRFRRMIEAIDKKNNFPAPPTGSSSPGKDKNKDKDKSKDKGKDKAKMTAEEAAEAAGVVTPELRELLSRKLSACKADAESTKAAGTQNGSK